MFRMPSAVLMKSLFVGAPAGVRTLTYFTREGGGFRGISWREEQRCRNLPLRVQVYCNANSSCGGWRKDLPVNYFAALRNLGSKSGASTSRAAGEPNKSKGPTVETPTAMQRKPYRPPRPSRRSRPAPVPAPAPASAPPPPPPPAPVPAPAPAAVEQTPAIESKEMDELVTVAVKVADASGDIIRTLFRTKMDVSDMDDENPVTVAECTAECAMSMIISQHFPTHSMYTEESGLQMQDDNADFLWVMDPIYGADSFMSGKPLFGTLLSLVYKGVPVLGILDQPILRERWIGRRGKETTLNGEPVASRSSTKALKDAYMFSSSPHLLPVSKLEIFNRVRDKVKVPQYGGDCYAYGLLATGHVDLVVESGLKPYDFLALIPVIEGAGGYITDWQGQKLKFSPKLVDAPEGGGTGVLAAGSEAVHKGALAALAGGKK